MAHILIVTNPDGLERNCGRNRGRLWPQSMRGDPHGPSPKLEREDNSRLVCRARIVSEVSPKRGRSFRIASSKAIICAVSNSEPIGRTESLPLWSLAIVWAG